MVDIDGMYQEYISKLKIARELWIKRSNKDRPLYIHGTYEKKLAGIWRDGIQPGGAVGPVDPLFVIPGYVSLQEIGFCARSGHGDITLILDGESLDPKRMKYHQKYKHEIYKGNIPIEKIIAIDIRDSKDAKELYNITLRSIPLVRNTDEFVRY